MGEKMVVGEIHHQKWNQQVLDLLENCSAAGPVEAAMITKKLFTVVGQAPDAVLDYLDVTIDNCRFSQLVDLGAFECAILQIYGPNVGFMVSRSPQGLAVASIACPGLDEETAFSDCLPVAMISCLCLLFSKHFSDPNRIPGETQSVSAN